MNKRQARERIARRDERWRNGRVTLGDGLVVSMYLRNTQMEIMREQGCSYRVIGEWAGITHERVRQILSSMERNQRWAA